MTLGYADADKVIVTLARKSNITRRAWSGYRSGMLFRLKLHVFV